MTLEESHNAESEDLRSPAMKISDEELSANQIPLYSRDVCAHLLVPLNRCRRENLFLPFRCHEEKHTYEICLYKEFLRRQKVWAREKEAKELAAEKLGVKENK